MTGTYCPDCYAPVSVPRFAREGRCPTCRPQRQRRHSTPRAGVNAGLQQLLADHDWRVSQ